MQLVTKSVGVTMSHNRAGMFQIYVFYVHIEIGTITESIGIGLSRIISTSQAQLVSGISGSLSYSVIMYRQASMPVQGSSLHVTAQNGGFSLLL